MSSSQGLEEEEEEDAPRSPEDAPQQSPMAVEPPLSTTSSTDSEATSTAGSETTFITVMIGATVPTGFEHTAAEEVQEKIGVEARISKDRGRIYFQITTDKLFQAHLLKSVDNLFVVVEEYDNYQFKDSKEETLKDLMQLASDLPWTDALEVWKMNNNLKKKKGFRRKGNKKGTKANKASGEVKEANGEVKEANGELKEANGEATTGAADLSETLQQQLVLEETTTAEGQAEGEEEDAPDADANNSQDSTEDATSPPPETDVLKFRVTCNRAGDKHSFSSNEAARDFGGAVQDFFQWKADMTKFDIEVLLNIHGKEVVIGVALTEESLHRRNITHFGPTTLRSTLCYGMLRLCKPQPSDIILDPMCGTGAIPLEGAIEFQNSFYLAGDNNDMAVNRTVHNICHVQKKRHDKGSAPGLPIDTLQWDLCHLPIRTSSVDIIITDMPFGKRMGSRKKNWDLYPSCLREMARVCRPGSGTAVLLTQDKKCFAKAISRMGGLWKRSHTVWVNVGGLHAGVFLLRRTAATFGQTPEDVYEPTGNANNTVGDEKDKAAL